MPFANQQTAYLFFKICPVNRGSIHEQYTHGVDLASFLEDDEKQDAVIRRLEILGEAAKRISVTTRNKNPDIRWRAMAGLRDIITHQYFGLSLDKIWNVTAHDLPELKIKLQVIVSEINDQQNDFGS